MPLNPAIAHWVKARIAERNKDNATAEQEYRAAIAASQGGARAWLNLAGFYRHTGRFDEMERALRTWSRVRSILRRPCGWRQHFAACRPRICHGGSSFATLYRIFHYRRGSSCLQGALFARRSAGETRRPQRRRRRISRGARHGSQLSAGGRRIKAHDPLEG